NRQTIPYIVVTNNTLRVGIKNIGAMTARWAGADEFKLRYLGATDEVLTSGYNSFKEEIQAQSDARYEALFTWDEAHTKADATGAIVNATCARQDTYGWTAATIDYSSGEAADGVSGNYYWNKWASSGYTSEMYQDFDFLPAGSYTFSVLARCSAAINFNTYVSRDGGLTKEYTQNMVGTGSVAAANSEYIKGWTKVTTPSVILRKGQSLRIGFTAENASGSAWWSTDNFALTYQKVDFTNLKTLNEEESEFQVVSRKGELLLISTVSTSVNLYNATGAFLKSQKINAGSTSIALPAGVYFIGTQKVIVR
ncbi:MAG: T9SS type A sorting domain-containing protein, partial [Bacteroidaceae bacterium]